MIEAGGGTATPARPSRRDNVVELVARGLQDAAPDAVTLNGAPLRRAASQTDFDGDAAGSWFLTDAHLLLLRSGAMPVATRKSFAVTCSTRRSSSMSFDPAFLK